MKIIGNILGDFCCIRIILCFAFLLSFLAFGKTWDETRYEYERATGNLIKKIYPDGHQISYTYHYNNLPKRITYASGKWMERNYNNRLQTVSTIYSSENTPNIYSTPNEFGTICKVEDSKGLIYDYGIHPYGQLLTNEVVSSPWMNWVLTHFHGQYQRENGWALSVENIKKANEYWSYNNNGKISYLVCTNSSGKSIEITYNYLGSYSTGYNIKTSSGAIFSQQLLRNKYRPELIDRISVEFSGNRILERNFEYNAINKVTRWHDSGTSNEGVYYYNRRKEVVQADVNNTRYAYGFDGAGNCKGFAIGSVTNFFVVNQLNQCTSLIFPSVNGSAPHEYDLEGNLIRVPRMFQYSWDCENRLISAVTQNGVVTNRYDYQNRLVKQDLPGSNRFCIFDRWNLIYERYQYNTGNTEEIEYFWGIDKSGTIDGACGVGGLIAVSKNGNFYFPYYGINGDILGYVNENGSVVASYTYGPFGELVSSTGSMAESFQFRLMTKRYDNFFQLYDFGDRWYSIALRRWISRDPLGEDGGINLYSFCENDPINKFDSNGCIPLDTIWDIGNIIYDICVGDEVALAADTAALFVPYVPAGSTKLVKAARLSQVEKICPGAKKLEVTYEYLPARLYKGGRHTLPQGAAKSNSWIQRTQNNPAKFNPGWGDTQIKALIDEAFVEAKRQGKIKPHQLDGFIYDARRTVGASKGNLTTRIKIHINKDGRNLHAFPY
jgi:RHS repeat-associated protein